VLNLLVKSQSKCSVAQVNSGLGGAWDTWKPFKNYFPSGQGDMHIVPAVQETEVGGSQSRSSPGQNTRPYLKVKRAGGVAQVVEHLPGKREAQYYHKKQQPTCISLLTFTFHVYDYGSQRR
jgi:hypothetical protein